MKSMNPHLTEFHSFRDLFAAVNSDESFFDPTCELDAPPELYDVTSMTSVIHRDQFHNYTSDPLFMQVKDLIRTGMAQN